MDVGMLEEEDMAMTLPVVSRMVTSRLTVDLDSSCEAEHEDSPFLVVVVVLSFSFGMYEWM